jgi:hypothetical protein
MVLKGRRIRFKEEERNEDDVNSDIDQVLETKGGSGRTPVSMSRDPEINANSFIGRTIVKKRDTVDEEKRQLNHIKESLQQHCDELEALNYIASGEPQMAVVDILEMINDFKKEFSATKEVDNAFTKMEQTILESTIDSFQGSKQSQN